jgi:geranylgeranyl diphosphate synthase type II
VSKALDAAIGIELFHNFTLMHDDIMDKAPLRRGNPTVHVKWNESAAILSGDVMFVEAYKLMIRVDDSILRKVLGHIL